MIGKITRLGLREVWRNEARDFTTWLLENLGVLSEIIEIPLQDPKREHNTGDFHVDLVAQDGEGNLVVIENQLEKSNHDHLGKIVTYVASLSAKTAVWIVSTPRPEHVQAITWLNESRLANFYLVKVEAIRIGESEPAPLLTLITGPSEETREVGDTKKDIADRYDIRRRFWSGLLPQTKGRTRLFEAVSPGTYSTIWAGAGKSNIGYRFSITQHEGEVSFYINRVAEQSLRVLNELKKHQAEIEEAFGTPLVWYQQEGVQHCRIAHPIKMGGYRDEEKWSAIQDEMVSAMAKLEKAIKPFFSLIPTEG